jgi:hypothetical protein
MLALQPVRCSGRSVPDRLPSAEDCIPGHRSRMQLGGVIAVSSLATDCGANSSHSMAAKPGTTRTTYASTGATPNSTATATRARGLSSASICMRAPLRLKSRSRTSRSPIPAWYNRDARLVDIRDPHRCSIPLYASAMSLPSSVAGRGIMEELSYERTLVQINGCWRPSSSRSTLKSSCPSLRHSMIRDRSASLAALAEGAQALTSITGRRRSSA